MNLSDEHYMQHALRLAQAAYEHNEVPVGALVVCEDKVIGEGWNQPIGAHDPTAHAEIIALRAASQYLRNYRLPNTTLYVTLEPCTMCIGAMIHARVQRLVFGAFDPKVGVVESLSHAKFNHKIACMGGCEELACAELLKKFFRERRSLIIP
jgi:tRNA(adenine34) deaminase